MCKGPEADRSTEYERKGKEKRRGEQGRGEERRDTRSYRALQALMKDLVLK